jgi:hypothetical protein
MLLALALPLRSALTCPSPTAENQLARQREHELPQRRLCGKHVLDEIAEVSASSTNLGSPPCSATCSLNSGRSSATHW